MRNKTKKKHLPEVTNLTEPDISQVGPVNDPAARPHSMPPIALEHDRFHVAPVESKDQKTNKNAEKVSDKFPERLFFSNTIVPPPEDRAAIRKRKP